MTKRPDRWEREVARGFSSKVVRPQDLILAHDAIKLLRKQHRWVEKLMQKRKREWEQPLKWKLLDETEALRRARAAECDDILAKLKARVK